MADIFRKAQIKKGVYGCPKSRKWIRRIARHRMAQELKKLTD